MTRPLILSVDDWTSGCRAKIARADEHLKTLYADTDRWGDTDPLVKTRESNADGSVHLFRLRFKSEPNVWLWAVLLGDALHNLRCALDYIVYALAVAQTGKDPPDDDTKLAFPITSSSDHFRDARWRIKSLDAPTQAAIERTQPYNRLQPGKWFMPLWWLSQLHDVDKHRLAHISVVAAHPGDVSTDAAPGTYRAEWNFGPLVDDTPIFRLVLSEPNPDVYVDFNATSAIVLNVKDVRPISLYWTIKHIRREVETVCRYLSRFFPAQPAHLPWPSAPSKG